jgi:hypothetical protein
LNNNTRSTITDEYYYKDIDIDSPTRNIFC